MRTGEPTQSKVGLAGPCLSVGDECSPSVVVGSSFDRRHIQTLVDPGTVAGIGMGVGDFGGARSRTQIGIDHAPGYGSIRVSGPT